MAFNNIARAVGIAVVLTASLSGWCAAADAPSSEYYKGAPPASADAAALQKWRAETRNERCAWWVNDRFGMFVTWGPSAMYGGVYKGRKIDFYGEWIMARARIPVAEYRKKARQFNPVKYDPDFWAALARQAGMKYIVITAKHADGFALFDSKATDWDVVDATDCGKDLLKPLAAACRTHGIKFCVYYIQSQDWTHPGGAKPPERGVWDKAQKGRFDDYIDSIAVPQVRELLSDYGPVGVIWWDTPQLMSRAGAARLYPLLKLQPHIIMNDRLGGGFGGDFGTAEQHIPGRPKRRLWETCMTINGTWGYRSWDHNWKSTEVLIRNLVDIVSKGGNYLLNVGPTAEGEIPAVCVERLQEIGAWMRVNGQSIYGCGPGPLNDAPTWGRLTAKPGMMYLHVFEAPDSRKLTLSGLGGNVRKAYLLADPKRSPLQVERSQEPAADKAATITISLPEKLPDPIDTVVAVETATDAK